MQTLLDGSVPALSVQHLSKSFGQRRVLSDVSFDIPPGKVHALLGQNGSGKSTLIKCLAGVHKPDPGGSVRVGGKLLPHSYPPSQSKRHHLAFVHQDLGLIADMTVMENLALGEGFKRRGPFIRWRDQRRQAQRLLSDFALRINPNTLIRDLPITQRTLLAIARALQTTGGRTAGELACLVLDEPTAALPDHDAEVLFAAISRVTKAGVAVAYVSHRLEEVFRLADSVSVLRDGRLTLTSLLADLTRRSLVAEIIGDRESSARETSHATKTHLHAPRSTEPVLVVQKLCGRRVQEVSFTLSKGELVGVAGLAGSGRSELARLLFGVQPHSAGTALVKGEPFAPVTPRQAMDRGVALVPEDRRREGCVLTMNVSENMTLASPSKTALGTLDLAAERRWVFDAIRELDIRPPDPDETISSLSGGNQQKVVLAKWFARNPTILMLDEPVQGVDVGAKADIFQLLRSAAARGTALLVIDSDFDNLVELCDRVLVLSNGRIIDELSGETLTAANISSATFGLGERPTESDTSLTELTL
jgi:ribose transport system ATP-binding protein